MIPPGDLAEIVNQVRYSHHRSRGGNSVVYRVDWQGREVAVKDYSARIDAATRLNREWNGLQVLHSKGLRIAPEPLGADFEAGIGVFEWVSGVNPAMGPAAVSAMCGILSQLHQVATAGVDVGQPEGQKAADSICEIGDMRVQVLHRLEQLKRLGLDDVGETLDAISVAARVVETRTEETGLWTPTLSPSDVGPHNLLHDVMCDTWRLIDLEFFGWDDAHKLTCDTLLHPLIVWEPDLIVEFLQFAFHNYGLNRNRLSSLFPWCSLKWATIVAGRASREFSVGRFDEAHDALVVASRYVHLSVGSSQNGIFPKSHA